MEKPTPNFAQLLQQSRQLTSHIQITSGSSSSAAHALPQLDRHLLQIDAQSKKLAQTPRNLQSSNASQNIQNQDLSALNNRTAFLFAQSDWDPDRVKNTLNSVQQLTALSNTTHATSNALPHVHDSDIDAYLTNHLENIIVSAIDCVREKTSADLMSSLDRAVLMDWDRSKNRFFEKLGNHQFQHHVANPTTPALDRRSVPGAALGSGDISGRSSIIKSLQSIPKMKSAAKIIRNLNVCRLRSQDYAICSAFKELYRQLDRTSGSTASPISDSWDLLTILLGERDISDKNSQKVSIKSFEFAAEYSNLQPDPSKPTSSLKKKLVKNGRSWLERQFLEFMQLQVQQHRAAIGGLPSLIDIARAYLQIRISQIGVWRAQLLEIHGGVPLFALVFVLVRAGCLKEAVRCVQAQAESLAHSEDARFQNYFEAWVTSQAQLPTGTGKLPDQLRGQLLQEYNTRVRHSVKLDSTGQWISGDAFKLALYKLIGRADLTKKALVAEIMSTTEDYWWFQLALTCEEFAPNEPVADRYNVSQMSHMLQRFGADHFSSRGKTPIVWFKTLLLAGEFERAVEYLWNFEQFQTDAVHFAIVLAYYGLLRVPESPYVAEVGMTLLSFRQQPRQQQQLPDISSLNFARMIHQYSRSFVKTDPTETLQYIYLVAMFGAPLPENISNDDADYEIVSTTKVAAAREYTRVTLTQIREVILLLPKEKYPILVGTSQKDGSGAPSSPTKKHKAETYRPEIEEFGPLFHITTHKSYLNQVVRKAAEIADKDTSRFQDSIMLFDIAEQYDMVVAVINRQLADQLSSSTSAPTAVLAQSPSPADIAMAEQLIKYYQGFPTIWNSQIATTRKQTVTTLLGLHRFITMAQSARPAASLKLLEELNLVPISSDPVAPSRLEAHTAVLDALDPTVAALVPAIMVIAMRLLHEDWKVAKEKKDRERERMRREAARSLVVFAGLVMFRIPQDVYAVLNRFDVMMG